MFRLVQVSSTAPIMAARLCSRKVEHPKKWFRASNNLTPSSPSRAACLAMPFQRGKNVLFPHGHHASAKNIKQFDPAKSSSVTYGESL